PSGKPGAETTFIIVSCLFGLCVIGDPCEVDENAAFFTDDPCVMSRWHMENGSRAVLHLGTVIHAHGHAPLQNIAGMCRLAGRRTADRLDVLGPAPSRFKGPASHRVVADGHDVELSF